MSVQISYKSNTLKKSSENHVLFVNDTFNTSNLKRYISSKEYSYVSDLLNINDKKEKIIIYEINSRKKIILVSIKKK